MLRGKTVNVLHAGQRLLNLFTESPRKGLLMHSIIPFMHTDQIRQLWYIRYKPRFGMVYQLCTIA